MIRLAILLLGGSVLRAQWWAFLLLALVCAALGVFFIGHLSHAAIIITIDTFGGILIIEGLARLLMLAAIGFPGNAMPVARACGFFALGFLMIDVPSTDNLFATAVIGAALLLDGTLRVVAALLIRSQRWKQNLIAAFVVYAVAILVLTDWPVPHRHTVPFCIGVGLLAAAVSLFRLGMQVRRLPAGASVTTLPLFAAANWHARGLLLPAHSGAPTWDNGTPLTVHVWTPVGSATEPQRRPVVDRYIAAVDATGMIATGHAALGVAPDVYISLCPANDIDHSPAQFRRVLRAGAENDVPGRFVPALADEAAAWRPPDQEVPFRRYNRAALYAFWEAYRQKPTYNLTSRNCSSTVALALDAAVEGVLGMHGLWRGLPLLLTDPHMWLLAMLRARAESLTWTPGLVLDYAQMLRRVVEERNQSWPARLRWARRHYDASRRTLVAEAQPTTTNFASLASVTATAMIFGLTYGLSAPLIALSLIQSGYGASFIGANAAMHAVGVLAVAPFLPGLAWRLGPKLPIAVALLAAAAVLALLPIVPAIWLWFPLRFCLGAAAETLFVMSETWLNELSNEATRARTMAVYTSALSVGFALGPLILAFVGPEGLTPYLIAAGIALLALLSVAMPWVRYPVFERPSLTNPLRYLALAPVAIAGTLLNAAIETAGLSFLAIYAMRAGWSERPATLLVSVLLIGAIVMQLPIGWLGDRMDRRRLVIGLAVASAAGALVWPFVLSTPWLAYPLLFVWGGLFVGIYTIMLAVVGSRFKGGNLVVVYALMSLAWGLGALVGPGAAGLAMDLARDGLPLFAAVACAMFAVFAVLSRRDG